MAAVEGRAGAQGLLQQTGRKSLEAIVTTQIPSMDLNLNPHWHLQHGQARPAAHHTVRLKSTLDGERLQDAGLVRTATGHLI